MKKSAAMYVSLVLCAVLLCGCTIQDTFMRKDKNGQYQPTNHLDLTVWETQGTDFTPQPVSENDIVAKWLEDKTKVTVKTMYGNGGGQWDVKLTNLLNSDALPHIIHCGAGQGPAHFAKLDQLGKVWELDEKMIQEFAPEVWRKTPKDYWEKIKVNGKILGIPYISPISSESLPDADEDTIAFMNEIFYGNKNDVTYSASVFLWIRDDILNMFYPEAKTLEQLKTRVEQVQHPIGDELLDIPIDSTEEFISFLYKIRDAGLEENGKTVYPFGYVGGDNWTALTWLGADMYGYKGHSYSGTWNSVTEEIEIPLVHETVKQAAKTQNQMIKDKVIDPSSLVHTMAQYKERILNGEYAIAPLSYIGSPDEINRQLKEMGKSFQYRPFITQVPAQEEYGAFCEERSWNRSLCFLTTLSYEEVCQVLNWINTQYTDEFEQVCYWGPSEAGLYETRDDGKRYFKDQRFNRCFIDGDSAALPAEERLGLQGKGLPLLVTPCGYSVWNPVVMHRKQNYSSSYVSAFKFADDSPHVTAVKQYPPCQVWSYVYADIPEVVTFWAQREQWESRFKAALASEPEDFEQQWTQAIDDLNRIVSVSEMERKMTEIARPLAENIREEGETQK